MTGGVLLLLGWLGCAQPAPEPSATSAAASDTGLTTEDTSTTALTTTATTTGGSSETTSGATGGYLPDALRPTDPQRLITLGDSITDGTGATTRDLSYPALLYANDDHTWSDWQGVDLTTRFPELTEWVDVSRGGATTDSLVGTQLPRLTDQLGLKHSAVTGESIAVLTIGGNDLQAAMFELLILDDGERDAHAEELIALMVGNLEATLDHFEDPTRYPDGALVYFANVYDPTDGRGQADSCFLGADLSALWPLFDDANAAMRDVAERRGAALIDMRGHFLGHGHNYDDETLPHYDASDPSLWLDLDCIHPNDRGHHEIRTIFYEAITAG